MKTRIETNPKYFFGNNTMNTISYVELKDHRYVPRRDLGVGSFCKAQLFTNEKSENVVIKTCITKKTPSGYFSNRMNEIALMEAIYQKDGGGVYAVNIYHGEEKKDSAITLKEESPYEIIHGIFVLMPFFPGDTLDKAIVKATAQQQLKIILAVARELERIHKLGILHGDIRPQNIIINQEATGIITVHFIDLEHGYRITDKDARTTNETRKECAAPHWSLERMGDRKEIPKPHFNQDMHSLGWTIKNAANNTSYPKTIMDFCDQCVCDDCDKRPSLTSLIQLLELELKKLELRNALEAHQTETKLESTVFKNGSNGDVFLKIDDLSDSPEWSAGEQIRHKKMRSSSGFFPMGKVSTPSEDNVAVKNEEGAGKRKFNTI